MIKWYMKLIITKKSNRNEFKYKIKYIIPFFPVNSLFIIFTLQYKWFFIDLWVGL